MPERAPADFLVIGDAFIPTADYRAALQRVSDEDRGTVRLRSVELPDGKAEQHAAQAKMEVVGPNALPAIPNVLAAVPGATVLGLHFAAVGAELIAAAAELRLITVARAGLENVDIAAATERGIGVVPSLGRNAGAVAELQIGMMLAETRNIARADASIRAGGWRKEYPGARVEIAHSVVGMVGFGHVGRVFAQRISGFGPQLLAYDPYASAASLAQSGVQQVADLTELFARSDFVLVQARLSPETARFIGAEQLAAMKPTAYFINIARSRLVDYDALYDALAAGAISGAALDTFDDEPLPLDSRWRSLDNVTMTTHFGGDTTGTNITSARLVVAAAVEYASTGRVPRAVNAAELGWR